MLRVLLALLPSPFVILMLVLVLFQGTQIQVVLYTKSDYFVKLFGAPQTTIKKPIGIHGFFGNRGKGVCGALLAFRPLRGLPCLLKTELAAFFGARIAREISQMFQCFAMFRIYFQ